MPWGYPPYELCGNARDDGAWSTLPHARRNSPPLGWTGTKIEMCARSRECPMRSTVGRLPEYRPPRGLSVGGRTGGTGFGVLGFRPYGRFANAFAVAINAARAVGSRVGHSSTSLASSGSSCSVEGQICVHGMPSKAATRWLSRCCESSPPVLKTGDGVTRPRVRIPASPLGFS